MPGDPMSPDKKLNARQELFAQGVASGMSKNAAYLAAGYKNVVGVYLTVRMPNVDARIKALLAEAQARNHVNSAQVTEQLKDIVGVAIKSESAAMAQVGRQALADIARINGLVPRPCAPAPPKPTFEPITEVRRIVVEPDGREWEY